MIKFITFVLLVVVGLAGAVYLNTSTTQPIGTLPDTFGAFSRDPDNGTDQSGPKTKKKDIRPFVARVQTTPDATGITYRVVPTRRGRSVSESELKIMWQEVVARGVPDQRNLQQQFRCHPLSIIARLKPSWNLESWRPQVGLRNTMLAGCNPELR